MGVEGGAEVKGGRPMAQPWEPLLCRATNCMGWEGTSRGVQLTTGSPLTLEDPRCWPHSGGCLGAACLALALRTPCKLAGAHTQTHKCTRLTLAPGSVGCAPVRSRSSRMQSHLCNFKFSSRSVKKVKGTGKIHFKDLLY